MSNEVQRPFVDNELVEKKFNIEIPKQLNNDAEMIEAMELYREISDIFIRRKTKLSTSYVVLSALADSVFTWITQGNE